MLQIVAVIALIVASPPAASFLPADTTPEIVIDPGMQLLSELVSSVTEFNEGDCESLVRKLLATRQLTLPAARVWLQEYADRPEQERLPWREHAAVMILALGGSGEKTVGEFLSELITWDASASDYASFPDFAGMQTGAKLREYAAYAYLALDPIIAGDLALQFIKKDPLASRVCALILDRCWAPKAPTALLDLVRKSSWTTTIATALQVLKRRDPSMYITALEVLRNDLGGPPPFFKTYAEQFRYYVRRKRIAQAFGICREEAAVKTLVKVLKPEDRGTRAKRFSLSGQHNAEGPYSRSLTEEALIAIQEIVGRDFGYADSQSEEERQAVIERCKRYVARHL